ncbi:ParA family protein [Sinomonas sp. ASV322]|uniref:ParA family protein n=1 Tax=Sinomonas sp. ASV322 TaxID=3041920 RepID=UPI0027DC5C60|nr:ParA family protein [Sinomonas sp. ASV322]MDQ4500780.1 ParA family protein [Sinomonas sp. ASV322]
MQVVSISSLKGGVGKTSVTTGLASAALAAGIPTLVVDLDPHADASTALGVAADGKLEVARLLKAPRRARLADNVVSSTWVNRAATLDGKKNRVLDVAFGGSLSSVYDRPDLGRRDLKRLSAVLDGIDGYDLVLIDCPPSLNGLTRMAWNASNRVLLVAEPGLFSVAGTERTMRAIQVFRQEFAPKLAPAGIIANRVRPSSTEHTYRLEEMKQMFGPLMLTPTIPELANWQQIQGAAHSVHHWPGEAARNTAALYDELLAEVIKQSREFRPRTSR